MHRMFFRFGAPGHPGHLLFFFLLLAVAAAAVVALVMILRDRSAKSALPLGASAPAPPRTEASRILDERYARGEIDDEEYQRRRTVLSSSS
jgi:putative membrane protein